MKLLIALAISMVLTAGNFLAPARADSDTEGGTQFNYNDTSISSSSDGGGSSSISYAGRSVIRDDGVSYTTYGNKTFDNRGNSWTTYGNTVYGSDGSSCTRYGNETQCY